MKTITVIENQNLWDISLQEYGDIEAVFYIVEANPLLKIDSEIASGQKINIPDRTPINKDVVNYYNSINYKPTSGSFIFTPTIIDPPTTNDGIVKNSNNTWNSALGNGGSLTVPDSSIILDRDYEGLEILKSLPATNNLTLSVVDENDNKLALIFSDGNKIVIEDIIIRNSNNSFNQLISLVNDNYLLDVVHTDSTGAQVTKPAMIPFVATPQVKDLFLNLNYKDTNDIIEVLIDSNSTGVFTTIPTGLTYSTDGVSYNTIPNPFTTVISTLYFFKRGNPIVSEIKILGGSYV